jgi:hypothetical protein
VIRRVLKTIKQEKRRMGLRTTFPLTVKFRMEKRKKVGRECYRQPVPEMVRVK